MIAAFGLVTSALVAVVLAGMEVYWGFAFYSVIVWAVVPVGAIVSGAAAAGGCWPGALLLRLRPSLLLAPLLIVASVSTLLFTHYAVYRLAPPTPRVPFRTYLDRSFRTSRMEMSGQGVPSKTTPELDDMGYVLAGVQALGFAVGGLVVFIGLRRQPYCSECRFLLFVEGRDVRTTPDARSFDALEGAVRDALDGGDILGAYVLHQKGGNAPRQAGRYRTVLESRECPGCRKRWASFTTKRGSEAHTEHTWSGYFDRRRPSG